MQTVWEITIYLAVQICLVSSRPKGLFICTVQKCFTFFALIRIKEKKVADSFRRKLQPGKRGLKRGTGDVVFFRGGKFRYETVLDIDKVPLAFTPCSIPCPPVSFNWHQRHILRDRRPSTVTCPARWGQWGQRKWNSVWWGKKYFVLGRPEQPRQNKNLLYRYGKP